MKKAFKILIALLLAFLVLGSIKYKAWFFLFFYGFFLYLTILSIKNHGVKVAKLVERPETDEERHARESDDDINSLHDQYRRDQIEMFGRDPDTGFEAGPHNL